MSLTVQIRKQLNNGQTLDVNFTCEDGCAILGASGSGKSVLLRCIAGLEQPDEGQISLDGTVLFDSLHHINLPPQKRRIGYLPTDCGFFPDMSVEENIHMALSAGGADQLATAGGAALTRKARRNALAQVTSSYLEKFDLNGLGGLYPAQLSGPQRIRAALCRMMAAEPVLILLDDPFGSLESYEKARTLLDLRERLQAKKVPVIFASRDREEVYAMSQHICVLDEGQSQPMKPRQEFFAHPETISGALLSGVTNVTNIHLLNDTHALAKGWRMIFSVHEKAEEPVEKGENSRPSQGNSATAAGAEAGKRKTQDDSQEETLRSYADISEKNARAGTCESGKDLKAGTCESGKGLKAGADEAGKNVRAGTCEAGKDLKAGTVDPEKARSTADRSEASSPEEINADREKRREELREDLARSLRFELINTDGSPDSAHKTGQTESAGSRSAVGAAAAEKTDPGSLQLVEKWQKLSNVCCAVGIRPEAFLTQKPSKGHYLTFRLHGTRIEEGLEDWKIFFVPYASDKEERTQSKGQQSGPAGSSSILWRIAKKDVDRKTLEAVEELYLPEEELLFLKKG